MEIKIFCTGCSYRINHEKYVYSEAFITLIGAKIPDSAVPVFNKPIDLQASRGLSVFDVATMNVGGEKVVDHTKLALRESWHGASIGKAPGEVDRVEHELDKELEMIRGAKPLTAEEKRKLLE